MDKNELGKYKKILTIIIIFLTFREIQAQDFSIKADRLVFNKESNIFSATGNVKIYFGDVTIKTETLTFNRNSKRISFASKIFIKTNQGVRVLGGSAQVDRKTRSTLAKNVNALIEKKFQIASEEMKIEEILLFSKKLSGRLVIYVF